MTEVLVVKDRIQRVLKDIFHRVEVTELGFSAEVESTKVFIDVHQITDADVIARRKEQDLATINIAIWAVVAIGVKGSPAMFEWIATEGNEFIFGGCRAIKRDDGKYNVVFEYRIAGESSDPMEIKGAILAVVTTADDLDDDFTKRFGGETFAE